jgi:hypothetical protein
MLQMAYDNITAWGSSMDADESYGDDLNIINTSSSTMYLLVALVGKLCI